ncbi:EamA family transporter [Streptomyces mayteni]
MATGRSGARYLPLAAIYLIWGSTYFAVRVVVGDGAVSPVHLQFLRAVAAAALLGVMALAVRRRLAPVPWRTRALAALSGVLMWAAGNGLATYSAAYASSSFIVMAMGTIPLWTVATEAVLTRTPPSRRVLGALGVGFLGLGLVVAPGLFSADILDPDHAAVTILMLVGGGATWAMGTALQKRVAPAFTIPSLAATQFTTAALVLAVPALAIGAPRPDHVDAAQWAAFGYLVVFGSAISLSAYAVVVRTFSASVASTFAYVNPVVGVLLGTVVLREDIAPVSILGLFVVLTAVGAVLVAPSARHGMRGAAPAAGPARSRRGGMGP